MSQSKQRKIVVAMSGGVDSAAAAVLLKEQAESVVGISMQVWDYRSGKGNSSKATCCAPADFNDAREVAEKCDFPYYVFDFEDDFEKSVIKPFVNSYLNGKTPNPCLECNRKVKFRELRRRAAGLGAEIVATGHYAQIKTLADSSYGLFTGKDKDKDQSYFLYAMKEAELSKTLFPVGAMSKTEVRQLLATRGISLAEKPESQDICFVSGSVGEFIEAKADISPMPGAIVNSGGEELGRHEGVYNYTVGQRKGLGIANSSPLYVLNIDASSGTVCVGERSELERQDFQIEGLTWIANQAKSPVEVLAKLRYRHPGLRCLVSPEGDNSARVEFLEDWTTVSPGQAAVFYSLALDEAGDRQVLGGGTIRSDVKH